MVANDVKSKLFSFQIKENPPQPQPGSLITLFDKKACMPTLEAAIFFYNASLYIIHLYLPYV